MKKLCEEIIERIHSDLESVDLEKWELSIEEVIRIIDILERSLEKLRVCFFSQDKLTVEDEIYFFKEVKPEVLGFLLYFNKIHTFNLKCPNGSNETVREYYQRELYSLTYFFERNLDFYQYYRSNATHLDEQYFTRKKRSRHLCIDSAYFVMDADFSTIYDYKIAKIICNEMLRIYLNKKLNNVDKQIIINKSRASIPLPNLKWTAQKVALVELGYGLDASKYINGGNADIKEIMLALEIMFNIDLGEYYRTYISIKERKLERTKYLNYLIESLIKRMDEDDAK